MLQHVKVEPATEVSREKWLRRASFDLTGLPPSLEDLDKFLGDTSQQAYENAVDRMLKSPAFGERMANQWLDVARYADTFGYQFDRDMHVWPWREWVIRAFNDNLPYDQFIIQQTAGDLLPNATRDQRLATTFNRLHRQTNEGGSIELEFRTAYIADRVVTNGTAFLGLTFECARCHDHKFDPLTQRDFYQFASFFANIDEHGLYSHFTETAPTPTLLLYEGDQEQKHAELLGKIRTKEAELRQIREEARNRFAAHPASKPMYAVVSRWFGMLTSPGVDAAGAKTDTVRARSAVIAPTAKFLFDDAQPGDGNKLVSGVTRTTRLLPGVTRLAKYIVPDSTRISPRESQNPAEYPSLVAEVLPGFTTTESGVYGIGVLAKHFDRDNVLRTHPVSQDKPCVLSTKLAFLADQKAELTLDVSHHPTGDWRLIVRGNGKTIADEIISKKTCPNGWRTITVDLSRFAGQEVELDLLNQANDWNNEFGYWGAAQIVTAPAQDLSKASKSAETGEKPPPPYAEMGKAIQFDGDQAFSCKGSGQFGRTTPFTFSLWVKPAVHQPREVVLHQSVAAEDAVFRGFSLVIDNGHPVISLVHFWPGNAIQITTNQTIPIDQWTHLIVTYDGSSRGAGLKLYVNGIAVIPELTRDKLTRDIKYRAEWGDSNAGAVELSLGARFRDVGFKGGAVDDLLIYDQELTPLEATSLFGQAKANGAVDPKAAFELANTENARFEHYLRRHDEPYQAALNDLQALRHEENELVTKVRQIMVMEELERPRPIFILKRGAYDAPGERVSADAPGSVLPFGPEFPRNRLGLARWMTDDRNPLVSRVAVNRFWSFFFGRGLVGSVEDFGGQGEAPSHPELLDWLARDFMDHGWNVKEFCKQVVLSATYRQSTIPRDPKLYGDDPDNRWLARGPRYRLSAEQVRDNALAVSGLLVAKLGGASVMPYQPVGLWEEAGTHKSYNQAKGEGLYRRSLYTFWRRTSPPPTMVAFDATSRETCTARRERTSTPLQALVLLNDPQFIEAARVLAQKLIEKQVDDVDGCLRTAFRLLTSRLPTDKEQAILLKLYREQRDHFARNPADATALLSIGDSPRNDKLNSADHAAMTVVVKALFSFEECITKR